MGAIYPGSESGTCFRTNRSCRLPPAHQVMKIEVLTGGGCHLQPIPTPGFPAFAGNDELGGRNDEAGGRWHSGILLRPREPFSYQSLMPAAAGTPKYEKRPVVGSAWYWHDGFCHAPPRPRIGVQAPALHFLIPPSTIGLRAVSPVESRGWRAHFRTNDGPTGGDQALRA